MSFLITSYKSVVRLKTVTSEKENKEIDVKDTHITARSVHTDGFVFLCVALNRLAVSFTKKGKESLRDKVKNK